MILLRLAFSVFMIFYNQEALKEYILFDGISLNGWEIIDTEGRGDIFVADSCIYIGKGEEISGIIWRNEFPKSNYEVRLDAKRVEGSDFFCGITFPVKESFLTLVLGGWGGSVTGLSCIDGFDAANNDTYNLVNFEKGKWYAIRLIVTDKKIEGWVDDEKIVDFTLYKYDLSLRLEVESSKPFGFTTYKTTGALKNIRLTTYD